MPERRLLVRPIALRDGAGVPLGRAKDHRLTAARWRHPAERNRAGGSQYCSLKLVRPEPVEG